MKTIQVTQSTLTAIKNIADGSFDENVNNLINEVGEYMPLVELNNEKITVGNVKKDTYDLLTSYRLSQGESFENILLRMLITKEMLSSQHLNNSDD